MRFVARCYEEVPQIFKLPLASLRTERDDRREERHQSDANHSALLGQPEPSGADRRRKPTVCHPKAQILALRIRVNGQCQAVGIVDYPKRTILWEKP